jgi:bifunctional UDP-N-acetylglucosamine pyrophosphorylase/glucosamine-1-phosphate N-acetyltransferase
MFVAPLEVGDGAYTGAGTVLRNNVPPGALAVSGGSQRNIEGWVERNRADTESARAAARARAENEQPHETLGTAGIDKRQKDGENQ